MVRSRKYLPRSEEELRDWFRANHQKLENNPSVVESWDLVKRRRFLAGYCLGFSSEYTLDSIKQLIPSVMLDMSIRYLEGESSKSAICIAVQAQNLKMATILLDLNASLDASKQRPFVLDYLTDAPDDVRRKFLQLICEKRGKTDLLDDPSAIHPKRLGVGHLLAALQLSPKAMDVWTTDVCAEVVSHLWGRWQDELQESNLELLAIIYSSGRAAINNDIVRKWSPVLEALEQDLVRKQLHGLKFMLRTLNADPNMLLRIDDVGHNLFLFLFDDASFYEILEFDEDSGLEFFELVFCELMTPRLKVAVLVEWLGRFMNQILSRRNDEHPPNYVELAVQRIVSLRHHNPGISVDLTNLLNQFVPRLLEREESEKREMSAVEPQMEVRYDQSQVFVLWKLMGASVPSDRIFTDILSHSAYLTFARLVWMFGKECPIHRVDIRITSQPEDVDGAGVRDKKCIEAFVGIIIRSTKKSASWFRFLEELMVKKGVSTESLLKGRMRLGNMAAAAWNDCNREHQRNINLPEKIRQIVFAQKEFEILENFGMED